MDDATAMMLADTIDNFGAWTLFLGVMVGLMALIMVSLFFFRLALGYAVRTIRRRFLEGRI